MSNRYLDQKDLARRWGMSPRTLERWRLIGFGPVFLKLGKKVKYRIEDIEAFERTQLRQSTPLACKLPDPESEAVR
jgi:predicted site-specific integrase-resolvase